jgi:hypothetical protein
MDHYLSASKGILGILEATLSEEERKQGVQLAEEVYQFIREKAEERGLNVRTILLAAVGGNCSVVDVCNEEIKKFKEE